MSTNEVEMMKNIRLLLVEDNAADARVVERHLKDAGLNQVNCDVVTTAGEAAQRLQTVEYDLVLLDLGLPDATGLQALRALTKLDQVMPARLRSQVAAVGIKPEKLFTADAYSAIHSATGGVPRLVNQLGDQLVWKVDAQAPARSVAFVGQHAPVDERPDQHAIIARDAGRLRQLVANQ